MELTASTAPDPSPANSPATDEATAAASPATVSDSAEERVFVLVAELDYATLELGFLVHRPQDPYAEINGVEIHEGQHVGTFLLEKVESDRVCLRDDQGPLIIKVR